MEFLLSAGIPVGIPNMNGVGPHLHKVTITIFGLVIMPRGPLPWKEMLTHDKA